MTEPYQQEELWRTQIAERVAAHKARQPSPPSASAPARSQSRLPSQPRASRTSAEALCPAVDPRQLTERAVENVRRRLEARMAREEAERREREELERFFAEFNRPLASTELAAEPVAFQGSMLDNSPSAPPSNLIAFPRGNTAAQVEILEAEETAPRPNQLTIFEALAESELELELERLRPTALRLDEHLDFSFDEEDLQDPEAIFDLPLKVAPIAMRAWAGVIDAAIVGACALTFASIFYGIYHQLPSGKPALVAALAILWVIWTVYQLLFLAYAGSTPGLKVMRLGISTYEDEVPSARTRVKRAIALLLTSMSCGLGFVWTLLDEDRLAWHDRMTRTFPRQLA